jgi:hypothetical protein
MIEDLRRDAVPAGGSNRSLGLVFAAFFAIIGLLPLFFGDALRLWALAVGAVFLLAALAFPAVLAPLNRVWTKFGLLLHKVVSPIVLGIMFYLAVTPTGLLVRLFGKDSLRLKLDRQARSYWIERTPPGPAPETLKDQF